MVGVVYLASSTAFSAEEHFHPKGKPPSKYTKAVLTAAAKELPQESEQIDATAPSLEETELIKNPVDDKDSPSSGKRKLTNNEYRGPLLYRRVGALIIGDYNTFNQDTIS